MLKWIKKYLCQKPDNKVAETKVNPISTSDSASVAPILIRCNKLNEYICKIDAVCNDLNNHTISEIHFEKLPGEYVSHHWDLASGVIIEIDDGVDQRLIVKDALLEYCRSQRKKYQDELDLLLSKIQIINNKE